MFRRSFHNFMNNFRYRTQRFMQGRYGSDQLNVVLIVTGLLLEIIYSFTGWAVLYILSLVLMILAILRIFSKNISKRYAENQRLLKFMGTLKILKTHHIYRCPNCKQKIRVPRKGGKKVEIRCPRCSQTFIKKI